MVIPGIPRKKLRELPRVPRVPAAEAPRLHRHVDAEPGRRQRRALAAGDRAHPGAGDPNPRGIG